MRKVVPCTAVNALKRKNATRFGLRAVPKEHTQKRKALEKHIYENLV
jgi:hypothetical protein